MSDTIELFTIGFTKKTAEAFFGLLETNRITTLVDIRLKPDTQLSGFAKSRDLAFFLKRLVGADYQHMLSMAPTDAILSSYRGGGKWAEYEPAFNALLRERDLIVQLDRSWWQGQRACLLCSEHEPDHCHRRLVAEYMAAHWPEVQIHHLK